MHDKRKVMQIMQMQTESGVIHIVRSVIHIGGRSFTHVYGKPTRKRDIRSWGWNHLQWRGWRPSGTCDGCLGARLVVLHNESLARCVMVWTGTVPRARGNRLAGNHVGVRTAQSVLVRIEA